ncbi:putative lipid transporter atnI [Fusarium oxysporum f. sp. albedinis]|jgi:hypothetical protein|nr:putative lipid transporter atnI [Fusarium oxysporum f. sp. albedinis]
MTEQLGTNETTRNDLGPPGEAPLAPPRSFLGLDFAPAMTALQTSTIYLPTLTGNFLCLRCYHNHSQFTYNHGEQSDEHPSVQGQSQSRGAAGPFNVFPCFISFLGHGSPSCKLSQFVTVTPSAQRRYQPRQQITIDRPWEMSNPACLVTQDHRSHASNSNKD